MGCADVRDLLPEHALGTLDPATRSRVDQHLAWCAGCRKEAAELAEGVAGVGLHLPPAEPPAELEDRVVAAVRGGAARTPRRRAGLLAAVLAAVVGATSLAWGLAVAGRPEPADPRESIRDALASIEEAESFVVELGGGGSVRSTRLEQGPRGAGGGGALLYDSPEGQSSALVIVGGLPADRGPFTAYLRSGASEISIGPLELGEGGRMLTFRRFSRSLSGFDQVIVDDAAGRRVLVGSLSG